MWLKINIHPGKSIDFVYLKKEATGERHFSFLNKYLKGRQMGSWLEEKKEGKEGEKDGLLPSIGSLIKLCMVGAD